MRFIVADDRPVTLADVRTALRDAKAHYDVDGDEAEATVSFNGHRVGHLTLNVPGDGLFDAERDELVEFAEAGNGPGKGRVVEMLRTARSIVAVQVLFRDGNTERTLRALDPLWHWLQANRLGLLQADDEGYYEGQKLILALD